MEGDEWRGEEGGGGEMEEQMEVDTFIEGHRKERMNNGEGRGVYPES